MIQFNKTTFHNFLHPYWVLKLIEAGVNVKENSSYYFDKELNVYHIDELDDPDDDYFLCTLTLSDLIYMIPEWIHLKNNEDESISAGMEMTMKFFKDAPFYVWGYYSNTNGEFKFSNGEKHLEAIDETPLSSLARFLLSSIKEKIKPVDNITEKYNMTKFELENANYNVKYWNLLPDSVYDGLM